MKFTKTWFIDALAYGTLVWVIGYALGMMLFTVVPASQLGWYILPVWLIVTSLIIRKRYRKYTQPLSYYLSVGIGWLCVAVVFDYIFLVQAFHVQNYYDVDLMIYYALTLALPVIVGWRRNKKSI